MTDNARTLKALDTAQQAEIFGGTIKAADKVIDFVGTKDQISEKEPLSRTQDIRSTYQKKNDEKQQFTNLKHFQGQKMTTAQELGEEGLELE